MFRLLILIIVIAGFSFAQPGLNEQKLFIPKNILSAYDNGTRSYDGNPGRNYWQNNSKYEIEVDFNPFTRYLEGTSKIIYYNNSPDSLNRIVLRLYQEIFSAGASRDWPFNPDKLTAGITITRFVVGDSVIVSEEFSYLTKVGTLTSVRLQKLLPPLDSIKIEVDWNYFIAETNLRTGSYDSTTYFIAYWYPEVAVCDDIDNWDAIIYSGTQEFYNDFSSFSVKISVPENFCVWATGDLKNPEKVLDEIYLNRYKLALSSDSLVRIIREEDLAEFKNSYDKSNKKVWHFKSEKSSAFAFALSDHYLWDGSSLAASDGNRIFTDAAYRTGSADFYSAIEFTKKVMTYFSEQFPNVEFPFTAQTIFNGGLTGGGMEHPMIVNNGTSASLSSAESLIAHEIAHQYFPFYVGTNEKKYAFMDEGFAVLFTINYQEHFYESTRLKTEVQSYQKAAGNEMEIPPMIPSNFLTSSAYRIAAYTRPALAFYYLQDYLGKEIFRNALMEFIQRWNYKHPIPYDLFFTFNEATGENLNWFWNAWFFESGFPDLKLDNISLEEGQVKLIVQNNGVIPIPVHIELSFEDGSSEIIYENVGIWKDGKNKIELIHKTERILKEAVLGSEKIPDVNPENNLIVIH
jgi:hypothetical protein